MYDFDQVKAQAWELQKICCDYAAKNQHVVNFVYYIIDYIDSGKASEDFLEAFVAYNSKNFDLAFDVALKKKDEEKAFEAFSKVIGVKKRKKIFGFFAK